MTRLFRLTPRSWYFFNSLLSTMIQGQEAISTPFRSHTRAFLPRRRCDDELLRLL